MNKNEILIIRALNNAQRHLRNGNEIAAKNAFDRAWQIKVDNSDVSWEIEKKIYWVRENYYQKKTFGYVIENGPDYEALILTMSGN